MNQPPDKKIYNGFIDCVSKTVQTDGVSSLWRGVRIVKVFLLVQELLFIESSLINRFVVLFSCGTRSQNSLYQSGQDLPLKPRSNC